MTYLLSVGSVDQLTDVLRTIHGAFGNLVLPDTVYLEPGIHNEAVSEASFVSDDAELTNLITGKTVHVNGLAEFKNPVPHPVLIRALAPVWLRYKRYDAAANQNRPGVVLLPWSADHFVDGVGLIGDSVQVDTNGTSPELRLPLFAFTTVPIRQESTEIIERGGVAAAATADAAPGALLAGVPFVINFAAIVASPMRLVLTITPATTHNPVRVRFTSGVGTPGTDVSFIWRCIGNVQQRLSLNVGPMLNLQSIEITSLYANANSPRVILHQYDVTTRLSARRFA